jgi:hypothetical protein
MIGSRKPLGFYTDMAGPRDPFGFQGQQPVMTPGIGDGLPGALPADPRLRSAVKGGMFANGGTGRTIAGILGDALAAMGGQQGLYGQGLLQKRQDEREDTRWQKRQAAELEMKRKTPQAVNLGDGGFGTWSPEGGLQIEREPVVTPKPSALEQSIKFLRTLHPNLTDEQAFEIAKSAMPGYGNTEEVYDRREALKGVPTYAATHPKGGAGGNAKYQMVNGKLMKWVP